MHSVFRIILLAFVAQVCGKELLSKHRADAPDSMYNLRSKLGNNLVGKLVDRAFNVWSQDRPGFPQQADLDDTTLAKGAHGARMPRATEKKEKKSAWSFPSFRWKTRSTPEPAVKADISSEPPPARMLSTCMEKCVPPACKEDSNLHAICMEKCMEEEGLRYRTWESSKVEAEGSSDEAATPSEEAAALSEEADSARTAALFAKEAAQKAEIARRDAEEKASALTALVEAAESRIDAALVESAHRLDDDEWQGKLQENEGEEGALDDSLKTPCKRPLEDISSESLPAKSVKLSLLQPCPF